MRRWQLRASAALLSAAMALGTPISAMADTEKASMRDEKQENAVEKTVESEETGLEESKESENQVEEKEKGAADSEKEGDVDSKESENESSEIGSDKEDQDVAKEDADIRNDSDQEMEKKNPESKSDDEEEKKETESESEKGDGDISEVAPDKELEKTPEADEAVPSDEVLQEEKEENARIQELIKKIAALPEPGDENFDIIKEQYDSIQALADEISELTEEEQEKVTNLKKLEELMEWVNGQIETTAMSGTCGTNARWTLDNSGTLKITGSGGIGVIVKDGNLATIWGKWKQPWKSSDVKHIEIGEGITWIGSGAFESCLVETVKLPSTLTSIYRFAFYKTPLQTLKLPKNMKYIADDVFDGCKSLKSVSLNEGLQEIGQFAFYGCENLSSITIPSTVKRVGSFAFDNCVMSKLVIKNGVKGLKEYAFAGISGLRTLEIPGSVKEIRDEAFSYCDTLEKVIIDEGVKTLDWEAFAGCKKLSYIKVPKSVTSVVDEKYWVTFWTVFSGNNLTLYGASGSFIESYAKKYDIPFVEIGKELPVINKIVNTCLGVHIYWDKIEGANSYTIYGATSRDGLYTKVASISGTNYIDTEVMSGNTYYYKVYTNDGRSSNVRGIAFVGTPDLTLRVNRSTGIGLGWNKISGATGYAVYRKNYNGNDSWVRVATITSGNTVSWTDTGVKSKNGSIYRYTVRALAGSDRKTLSGCRNTGRTMVRLMTPVLNSVSAASTTSMKAAWGKNSQASGYEVRLMVGGTVYKTYIVGGNANLTKTITGLKKGTTYKVQVRAYKKVDGVGSFYSAWSGAKNVVMK